MKVTTATVLQPFKALTSWFQRPARRPAPMTTMEWVRLAPQLTNEIEPDDALIDYLVQNPDVTKVDRIPVDSPAVRALRDSGVVLVVPLVSQGELIGLLNLGPRRSDQGYSWHDRRLLSTLSSQAATALRVAQLAHQERIEALERERLAHELRVAGSIQQMLLPQHLPELDGWTTAAHYQPARAVGGDFYDFIETPDGRLVIVVADVSDKGIPAALLMASTRMIVRAAATRSNDPGEILASANAELAKEIPAGMFVTVFCGILDPQTGHLQYANAGHTLPYRRTCEQVNRLHATGFPLGLFPEVEYDTFETTIQPGECLLFLSDGMTEAHNPSGKMFGDGLLGDALLNYHHGQELLDHLLAELAEFTGPDWEQEDDVTLLTLRRMEKDNA
jgi:serine phosphatase RsbU (regulator of sigma subunit)